VPHFGGANDRLYGALDHEYSTWPAFLISTNDADKNGWICPFLGQPSVARSSFFAQLARALQAYIGPKIARKAPVAER
jgi:hypothetical protein